MPPEKISLQSTETWSAASIEKYVLKKVPVPTFFVCTKTTPKFIQNKHFNVRQFFLPISQITVKFSFCNTTDLILSVMSTAPPTDTIQCCRSWSQALRLFQQHCNLLRIKSRVCSEVYLNPECCCCTTSPSLMTGCHLDTNSGKWTN